MSSSSDEDDRRPLVARGGQDEDEEEAEGQGGEQEGGDELEEVEGEPLTEEEEDDDDEDGREEDQEGGGGGRGGVVVFNNGPQWGPPPVPDGGEQDRSSSSSSSEDEEDAEREAFDPDLPTRHSYLGNAQEVGGRTILEEDLVQELVTFSHPGIILLPGQTMPLTLFRPQHVAAMKRLIDTVKTFGSLYARLPSNDGPYQEANMGTTAEIFEYRDPPEDGTEVGFKVKVRGRQRFRVLSSRTQVDGTRLAKVEILREVKLSDPFAQVRLASRDRLRFVPTPKKDEEAAEEEEEGRDQDGGGEQAAGPSTSSSGEGLRRSGRKRRSSFRETLEGLISSIRRRRIRSPEPANRDELKPDVVPYRTSRQNNLRTCVYSAPLTPFPNWVYEQYDARVLVERVHRALSGLRLFSHARVSLPSDPEELSFWVACNLPIADAHRFRVLELDSAVQRLRYELGLLKKYQILCCRHCGEEIATQDDIFSVSQEGPQSAYVNPGGYVHETLTLYGAKRLSLQGAPSTEYSWFPGYAWTIAQCRGCDSHMGWKFTACDKKLHPKKFWGISRQNIRPLLHAEQVEEEEQERERDEGGGPRRRRRGRGDGEEEGGGVLVQ